MNSGLTECSKWSISLANCLDSLCILLTNDVSNWSESHSEVIRLLEEAEMASVSAIIDELRALLC